MTSNQTQRQKHRSNGQYAKVNPCCVCGKSAGVNYESHPDTDHTIDDELICLCRKCANKLRHLSGPEAIKLAFSDVTITKGNDCADWENDRSDCPNL